MFGSTAVFFFVVLRRVVLCFAALCCGGLRCAGLVSGSNKATVRALLQTAASPHILDNEGTISLRFPLVVRFYGGGVCGSVFFFMGRNQCVEAALPAL